ncbi:MAG: ABC transporter permease [Flavobacteriales bacterium]
MLLKLAWRNIWRNKRRTFITLAMIQFAVVLATFMSAFRYGILDAQVENVVGGYQGYGAINDTSFVDEPNIENTVPFNDSIKNYLNDKAVIKSYSPRILGVGMMTCGDKFKITKITGVDPDLEDSLTHLSNFIVRGRLMENPGEVVLGGRLSKRLKADLDSLVFVTGMGYHGNTANMLLKVVGIINLSNVEEDKRLAFITLDEARQGFALYDGVNQIVLAFNNNSNASRIVNELKDDFELPTQIYSWDELNESLYMLVQVNDAGNVIISSILYFVISFGLFGTILMMLAERKREFGMLIAIGMKKSKLAYVVYLENILMGVIGTAIGFVIAIPLVYYFHETPIDLTGQMADDIEKYGFEPTVSTSMSLLIFLGQAIAVLSITLIFSLYSIFKIRSMNAIKAMRE